MLPHLRYGGPFRLRTFQQNTPWTGANQGGSVYELNSTEQPLVEAAYTQPEVDIGKYYPCDQEDIDTVYSPPTTQPLGRLPQPQMRKVSINQAISDLKRFNNVPVEACADRDQVFPTLDEYLFNRPSIRDRDVPGLVFKAFRDLDSAFFQSYLFGRVHLTWAGTGLINRVHAAVPPMPGLLKGCTDMNTGVIRIMLCVDSLLLRRDPRQHAGDTILDETLEVLLHEMLHAYLYVRCHRQEIPIGRGLLGSPYDSHPVWWWDALRAVAGRAEEAFGYYPLTQHVHKWI